MKSAVALFSSVLSGSLCAAIVLPSQMMMCSQPVYAIETDVDGPDFSGQASYYADCFHGRRTASGQLHDKTKLTAAHRTLPFGTKLKLVNRHNHKSCIVTVNDRGPFTNNRVLDVSKAAAQELGLISGPRVVDVYIISMP